MATLLVCWIPALHACSQQYDVLDYYAGEAQVARMARRMGLAAAAFDIEYSTNPRTMDMTTAPGFAFPWPEQSF